MPASRFAHRTQRVGEDAAAPGLSSRRGRVRVRATPLLQQDRGHVVGQGSCTGREGVGGQQAGWACAEPAPAVGVTVTMRAFGATTLYGWAFPAGRDRSVVRDRARAWDHGF